MVAAKAHGLSGNSTFARAIADAASEEIARQAQQVADDAVRRANDLVSKLYVTDRAGSRRRPGRHLLGSFRGVVTLHPGARIPIEITLRSSAPGVKVNSLNSGSSPHTITGHGGPLGFPGSSAGSTARSNARSGKSSKRRDSNLVVVPKVDHPGTRGTHFMETALEQAVSSAYRKAVRIPRR